MESCYYRAESDPYLSVRIVPVHTVFLNDRILADSRTFGECVRFVNRFKGLAMLF